MSSNPYAPPRATLEGASIQHGPLELWNPWAAVLWSILLTPAFGAFLHMKNWEALGFPHKAEVQRRWVYAVLIFLSGVVVMALAAPDAKIIDQASRVLGLAMLFGWYYSSAKEQRTHVRTQFGESYKRKGWLKPLLVAVVAFAGYVIVAAILGFALGVGGEA